MKKIIILIALLAIIGFVLAIVFRPQQPLPAPIAINTDQQPMLGNANAKVHIVAFEDLKCMACQQFNTTVLPQIKQNYINTGIANYAFINLAFIPGSMPAANAARCLYQQNPKFFFPFIEYVYQHQPPENTDWATIPKLVEFASNIPGIDQQKLSQCIYDSPHTSFLENNYHLAEQVIGKKIITPSVFINGIKVDPLTYKQVEYIIKRVK